MSLDGIRMVISLLSNHMWAEKTILFVLVISNKKFNRETHLLSNKELFSIIILQQLKYLIDIMVPDIRLLSF